MNLRACSLPFLLHLRCLALSCLIGFMLLASSDSRALAQTETPVYHSERYTLWPDRVTEGSYHAVAVSRSEIESNYPVTAGSPSSTRTWKLQRDISAWPQLHSDYPLLDAIYNLSLEELELNMRADGTFNTGAQWEGVWTRDISYSTLLSLAAVAPDAAKASLLRRVRRGRIVQDTGTGGSWPVSTDRVVWAQAAWEVYLVTGDRNWLRDSYAIIRDSVLDDEHVVIDSASHLARGESTFLDWREQTYPRWMEPADIYSAQCLSTNAVYYRTYRILADAAAEIGQPAQPWNKRADRIQSTIESEFWLSNRGFYGQYRYGVIHQTISPRADALGNVLAVLFDLASPTRQDTILRSQPLMDWGIPTVFPETPNIRPYHNDSVWPFVQSFWNLAAAKRRNQAALLFGLASVYRASALFLTNKENFVADTGSSSGTAINSDRQLWSVAGNLALTYRVFFGMEFAHDGLHLHPVIPESLKGTRTLSNFHYRGATLKITVNGFGSSPRSITLDGKPALAVIPADLTGEHQILINMDDMPGPPFSLNLVGKIVAPETPLPRKDGNLLNWEEAEGAVRYKIYRNGEAVYEGSATHFEIPRQLSFAEYQVSSVDGSGVESFLSRPLDAGAAPMVIPAIAPDAASAAKPFIMLDSEGKIAPVLMVNVPRNGKYALTFRYANGNGPINTKNQCAIRTLFLDGAEAGAVIFPQRGKDQWDDWGASNTLLLRLFAGTHRIELRLTDHDINMNGDVNRAAISSLMLTAVE
jgi:hypothetical protein